MIEKGLLYTKDHEWVKVEGNEAVMGISHHAQEQLGELTYVELPAVGEEVEAGGDVGSVESSKAASDVYAPVGGKVVEVNSELEDQPELINQDCYGKGWICKIEMAGQPEGLMDAEAYEKYVKDSE